MTTLAGVRGARGVADGVGGVARLWGPSSATTDATGLVYITDGASVRTVAADGTVTTIAGQPATPGTQDGTGAVAGFVGPTQIAAGRDGAMYVADGGTVRRVTPAGVVTTLAGQKGSGNADGTGATASFGSIQALAVGPDGNLYAADSANSSIRRITPAGVVSTVVGIADYQGVRPGVLPTSLNTPVALAFVGKTLYIVDESAVLAVTDLL